MFNSNTPFSMPVVPASYGTNNNGFGSFGSDWIGLIVILALLGWGGNGFGFGGNRNDGYPCATQADVRAAVDQQTLISKIDQQTYGLSSTFTALNDNLNSNFRGIDNAICTLGYQNQQGFSNLSAQLASCCCETGRAIERGFADTNYNLATQTNAIQNAMCNNTRDIIDNQNANSRAVLDFLVNDKLATLQAENQNLKLKASQAEQNAYLLNELKPCPSPAYVVQPPTQVTFPVNTCGQFSGYGYNGGCGCGCA